MREEAKASVPWYLLVTFVGLLAGNILAETLPFFGKTTGEISAQYPNLFTPPPFTFSIWLVIYALLGLYVAYALGLWRRYPIPNVGRYFVLTALLNVLWLVVFHAEGFALALGVLLVLAGVLFLLLEQLRPLKLSKKERFFLHLPFAVYAAWVTVAVFGNFTLLLLRVQGASFRVWEQDWTLLALLLLTVLALFVSLRYRSLGMACVFLWAFGGLLWRHQVMLEGQYPLIVLLLWGALLLLGLCALWLARRAKGGKRLRDG